MRDILDTLERWTGEGLRVATATLVKTERSAPREPGAVLAVSERGDVVGSVQAALATPAGYTGALGAKRTNAERAERLRGEGVPEESLARIHAPIGLDIGARTPEEVAVAVAAEIVALSRRAVVRDDG